MKNEIFKGLSKIALTVLFIIGVQIFSFEIVVCAIFANIINYFIFRVSKLDANVLVDNFDMKIPLDDSRDRKIKLLTELNNRECIVRLDSNGVLLPAFKGITLDYTSIPRIKRTITNNNNNINNKDNSNKSKTNFSLNSNVSLKDILISNSTSKKVVWKNEWY